MVVWPKGSQGQKGHYAENGERIVRMGNSKTGQDNLRYLQAAVIYNQKEQPLNKRRKITLINVMLFWPNDHFGLSAFGLKAIGTTTLGLTTCTPRRFSPTVFCEA